MLKINYYAKKVKTRFLSIFSIKRIKKFGVKMAILDFLIFLMHRNNSNIEHWLIRKKDIIVQNYIYNGYSNIIKEIRSL
jgi:hypothetical protein